MEKDLEEDFLRATLTSNAKKLIESKKDNPELIYTVNFGNDVLYPSYISFLQLLNLFYVNNKFKTFWALAADTITHSTNLVYKVFHREATAHAHSSAKKKIHKDTYLAKINLFKIKSLALTTEIFLKTFLNKPSYDRTNEKMKDCVQLFKTFKKISSANKKNYFYEFLDKFVLTLPSALETDNFSFSIGCYIQWVEEVFLEVGVEDESLKSKAKCILNFAEEKKKKIFLSKFNTPKELKPFRSRHTSFDKSEHTFAHNKQEKKEDSKLNYTLEHFYKKVEPNKNKSDDAVEKLEISTSVNEIHMISTPQHSNGFSLMGSNQNVFNSNNYISSSFGSFNDDTNETSKWVGSGQNTSFSKGSTDDLNSVHHHYSTGINSRLRAQMGISSKFDFFPTIRCRSNPKHKRNEKDSICHKIKSKLFELNSFSNTNEDDFKKETQKEEKTEEEKKNEKFESIKKHIQKNFYCEKSRSASPIPEKNNSTNAKTEGSEILAYRTPPSREERRHIEMEGDMKNMPERARKNLLKLFLQEINN